VFHLCPMFGGSLVGKTLLGPVSGSFQGTLVSFTETLGFVVGLVQTRFYGADSAKLGKGKILQRYRNVIVHPPCCCVYFQPNSRQPAFVTAGCTIRVCGQT
jgi:hypothetical protein